MLQFHLVLDCVHSGVTTVAKERVLIIPCWVMALNFDCNCRGHMYSRLLNSNSNPILDQ